MTRDETKELLLAVSALYPNFKVENKTLTINTWHWALEDYPIAAVKAALQIYVKTNDSGFAPSVSQLINAIHMPTDNDRLSEGEAWALVKKAIQDSAYHAEERFNELPEIVQRAVGSPNILHQWSQTETDTVNTVIMSNFERTYRAVLSKQGFKDRVPDNIAGIVKGLAEKVSLDNRLIETQKEAENGM